MPASCEELVASARRQELHVINRVSSIELLHFGIYVMTLNHERLGRVLHILNEVAIFECGD